MANDSVGTKMDTAVKLVLIFFISLLSFAVGTFVGKGVSDSEYREAALESGDYKGFRQTASVDPHATEVAEPEKGITDEEIASLTEEFVKTEKNEMAQEKDAHSVPGETRKEHGQKAATDKDGYKHMASSKQKGAHKTVPAPTEKKSKRKGSVAKGDSQRAVATAAERVAKGQAPVANPKKVRKPDSVLPGVAASAIGKYTVQIASYPKEADARKHAANLKSKGFNAFYIPAKIKGNTWFRVSIGLFTSQKTAMGYREELKKDGSISTAIVQKVIR